MLDCSADQLLWHAYGAVRDTEPGLQAWACVDRDASGQVPEDGPLRGYPVGVKDVIDVRGLPTRAGSASLADAAAATTDATAVSRLRNAGAIILGKTATTEFAYLDPCASTNPFNPAHTPGGSSSGSAAAVGAGVVPIALGTQTAGSVCRPAAFCGTYAFKPSTGRTPVGGVTPFAPSFDTIGVLALDMALACCTALTMLGERQAPAARAVDSLVIGYLEDDYYTAISPACRQALDHTLGILSAAGATLRPMRLGVNFERLRVDHRSVMHREAYLHHGYLLNAADRLGPHWASALRKGALIDQERYTTSKTALAADVRQALERLRDVDTMLLPPVRETAPRGLGQTGDAGLIIPWTCIGSPLAVLPVGLGEDGLPLAVMLAGQPGDDARFAGSATLIAQTLVSASMSIDGPHTAPKDGPC